MARCRPCGLDPTRHCGLDLPRHCGLDPQPAGHTNARHCGLDLPRHCGLDPQSVRPHIALGVVSFCTVPALSDIQIRDPFVVQDGADYYLFGSTDPDIWKADGIGFDVYRATDATLLNWAGPVAAFRPDADFYARKNFWAPEVYRVGNDWFLFATFKPRQFIAHTDPRHRGLDPQSTDHTDPRHCGLDPQSAGTEVELRRGTAILKSSTGTIEGPYLPWSDGPVTPPEWETLDGTLFIADDDTPWMVFCHEWQQIGDGTIEAMPLTPDLKAAAGPPTTLFRASDAVWSAPLANRPPGSYVTDGPYLYRDSRGYLKCLWSTFNAAGNYVIGEAVSELPDGAPGGILGPWRQAPMPIFSGDGGHGMLFDGPDARRYLAVHSPNATPNERAFFFEVTESPAANPDSGPAGWLQTTGLTIS